MFDFSGKTVLVTGGAQGIGKETVKGVVAGGGHAVILDINEEVGKATAAEVGNCSFYKIDLGSSENIRAVMAQVLADFDRVDVLINVGGVISKAPFEEISDAEWERTLRINLTGTFTTCSAIYPLLQGEEGRPHRERFLRGRQDRRRPAGHRGLRLLQGGRERPDQGHRQGRRQVRHLLQRGLPLLHHDQHDQDPGRGRREERQGHRHDSSGPRCQPVEIAR